MLEVNDAIAQFIIHLKKCTFEVDFAGGGERKHKKGNRATFGDNTVATFQVGIMIYWNVSYHCPLILVGVREVSKSSRA